MWVLPRLLPRRPASSPYFHPSGSCRSVNPKPTGSDFCGVIYRAFSCQQRDSNFRLPPPHPATMNIFRLTGDLSHLAAIIILLLKIWKSRSCAGISGKSQILFALVFTTRYLDLLTSFISLYNTSMKVIYIGCSYATVYLIYMKFRATYDGNHDSFRVEFLVVPVGGLAVLINHDFSPLEILWTFSIYLESVAILPQLFMISKTGEAETITTHYLFCLGLYRALYLFNWIWRFYFEGFFDMIAIVAGVVQTVLYCDFFYLYVTKVLKGKKLSLPA
ncbi:hypothetical protein OJAV_G00078600 [Oryzias javanicus]|uniref:ER lumen protein-retaining receptor n=1 Tax=Oryzias javanicus TaxID=123683 RepID=A0A437D3S5_ORYJA|nr:hypothetical protein OJAV_G00078600 [Oryzias javanicus]